MDLREMLETIADKVQTTASVKTIVGDPIRAEGKTIVPIARVAYGFGAGGGWGSNGRESGAGDGGGGGGGGVRVTPLGVLEITPESTRFLPIGTGRRLIAALALGVALGLTAGRFSLR